MSAEASTEAYYRQHASEYFAATYAADLSPLWNTFSRRIGANASIVDLGCGSGRDLRYFSQQGFQVTGVDYSYNLLRLAKVFSGQPVVLADLRRLPFASASFDAAWAIGALLHVVKESLAGALSEIHRVLKDDALFLSSMKKGSGEIIDSFGRYTVLYSPREWECALRTCGYRVLEIEENAEIRQTELEGREEIVWLVSLAMKA